MESAGYDARVGRCNEALTLGVSGTGIAEAGMGTRSRCPRGCPSMVEIAGGGVATGRSPRRAGRSTQLSTPCRTGPLRDHARKRRHQRLHVHAAPD